MKTCRFAPWGVFHSDEQCPACKDTDYCLRLEHIVEVKDNHEHVIAKYRIKECFNCRRELSREKL